MDPMERAQVLFSVFKSCVEHAPMFGGLMASASRELKAINDEATKAEAEKALAEKREAAEIAEKERIEREKEIERQRIEDEKVSGRPLVKPVDPALVQPRQMTPEEIEELKRKEREKLRGASYPYPQPETPPYHPPPPVPARSPLLDNEHNENPRRV